MNMIPVPILINTKIEANLTEPVVKLLETLNNFFEPQQVLRKARAEAQAEKLRAEAAADASRTLAQAATDVEEVALRARHRRELLEQRQQRNLEAVVGKAVEQLPNKVAPDKVDEAWLAQYFNYAQDIGNEEMQLIWARLLAGEVAKPGSFSPRTLQAVRLLRPSEAALFQLFCNYIWEFDNTRMALTGGLHMPFDQSGIGFDELFLLDAAGLIEHDAIVVTPDDDTIRAKYGAQVFTLQGVKGKRQVGIIITPIAGELLPLCDVTPDGQYLTAWLETWRGLGIEVSPE